MDKIDFSLIIPFHNEEENVYTVLTEIIKCLNKAKFHYEILAVDNNSQDKTGTIITELTRNHQKIKKIFVKELGYGSAVRGGLNHARGKWIGWTDGDQQIQPNDLFLVMKKTLETNAIFCKAERRVRYDGILRIIFTFIYRIFISILCKRAIYDVNGKPKFFRRSIYKKITLNSYSWFIDAEIVIRFLELGVPIINVPTPFYARRKGKSSVNLNSILRLIKEIRAFLGI